MTTYKVRAERDGKFWYVSIPELDGATQARHLGELDAMARDWIHCMTDEDPATIELDVEIDVPESVRSHLDRQDSLRAEAAAEARLAAKALRDEGIPLRDIGKLLGISHQRVHQLVSGK
jgi:hypothetical protein